MKKPDRVSVFKNSLTTELILTLVIGFCSIRIAADQDHETTPALDPVWGFQNPPDRKSVV